MICTATAGGRVFDFQQPAREIDKLAVITKCLIASDICTQRFSTVNDAGMRLTPAARALDGAKQKAGSNTVANTAERIANRTGGRTIMSLPGQIAHELI